MKVVIIDYGMGNLGSVRRAFEECGADVVVSDDPASLSLADRIVLPGVGAFAQGMNNLRERGWIPAIRKAVVEDKTPFLGICLGMQLLATKGFEGGEVEGLDLIPGEVRRLQPGREDRIPHVGWNEVTQAQGDPLFSDLPNNSDFYFVHSFHFVPSLAQLVAARTPYCGDFVSVVHRENVYGVQFHPEKSQKPGFKIIQNFLKAASC